MVAGRGRDRNKYGKGRADCTEGEVNNGVYLSSDLTVDTVCINMYSERRALLINM